MLRTIVTRIPDTLTFLRVVFAVILISTGLDGRANLSRDIWLLVASWTSDMVDGRLSRSLKIDHTTWLGKHDVYVDMFVSVAVLFYLTATRLLPLWLVLTYLLVWILIFVRFGIPPLAAQVFQNPIYAAFVFFTLQDAPHVLPWLLLWAAVSAAFFWRRILELYNDSVRTIRGQ